MGEKLYHVLVEDRRLGPYDRRTVVGMRMKKALSSGDRLEAQDGACLSVGELVFGNAPEAPAPSADFDPDRSGSYSVVQAVHSADVLEVQGSGYAIPAFKGEVEVRVQTRALRIAGRCREGLAWKEDRIKFPLQDIVHARLLGSVVELGVRPPEGAGLQRLRLDLHSAAAAGELVERLPHTVPWPGSEPLAGRVASRDAAHPLLWVAFTGTVVVVGAILVWVLTHRV